MNIEEFKKMYLLEEKHFWFVGKRLLIKTILDKYLPKKTTKKKLKILDVGCGTGGTTKFLSGYGEIVGFEKNLFAKKLAEKRKIKVILGDAENLPFQDATFNLVCLFDILYHKNVKNEKKVIKETFRVLKPNGFLLITDSAFKFLQSKHDNFLGGKRRFTLSYIKRLLEENGFKILRASYIFFTIFPLIFLKRKIIDKFFKPKTSDVSEIPFLINWILIKTIKSEAWMLKFFSFPFGSSLIALAKKITKTENK